MDSLAANRPGTRGRKTRMSQEYVAHLIGVSVVWYGRLERGICGNYSDEFLDRVAAVLRLTDAERALLYMYAVGRTPQSHRDFQYGVVGEALRDLVARQVYPAYISDPAWDLICYNDILAEWFPTLPASGNIMRWVFLEGRARQQLLRWSADWAPVMLAQLRMASARVPADNRLEELVNSILNGCETARELWRSDILAYSHPDGDVRRIVIHGHRESTLVEIVATSPLRAPDCRLVVLSPAISASRPSIDDSGTLPQAVSDFNGLAEPEAAYLA